MVLTRFHQTSASPRATVTLPWERRKQSRLRAVLHDGTEAAIQLPRGTVLRDGDLLISEEGDLVAVRALAEPVSVARAEDAAILLRAAYHLGNRHVPLQIALDRLVYHRDHVLDAMLRSLGLDVAHEEAPFEPEPGSYHGHSAASE